MADLSFHQQPLCEYHGIPAYMTHAELEALATLAAAANGETILEIGSCYGASTAALAMGAPDSLVYALDAFLWSPIPEAPAGGQRLAANLSGLGIANVHVIEGDSRVVGATWKEPLGLLFVDGGHDYDECLADLEAFAPHAACVCVHDYLSPYTPGVTEAVGRYCAEHGRSPVVLADTLAVLRRQS